MKKIILLLIALSFLTNCGQNESKNVQVQASKSEWHHKVISIEDARNKLENSYINVSHLFNDNSPSDLNTNEIDAIYSILSMAIQNYNVKHKRNIEFDNYRFYIVPTLNDLNQKIVFITAFCFNSGDDWEDYASFYMIRDGGDCYFRASFPIIINGHMETPVIIPNGEA